MPTSVPTLNEVADHCIEARQTLGSDGSQMLRLLLDMILLEVGKELGKANASSGNDGVPAAEAPCEAAFQAR